MTKNKSTQPVQKILESYIPLRREREALERTLDACTSERARALHLKIIRQNELEEAKALELISRATNPIHRELLTLHYIDGYTWEQTAEKMHYSEYIYRIRRAALKDIAE